MNFIEKILRVGSGSDYSRLSHYMGLLPLLGEVFLTDHLKWTPSFPAITKREKNQQQSQENKRKNEREG